MRTMSLQRPKPIDHLREARKSAQLRDARKRLDDAAEVIRTKREQKEREANAAKVTARLEFEKALVRKARDIVELQLAKAPNTLFVAKALLAEFIGASERPGASRTVVAREIATRKLPKESKYTEGVLRRGFSTAAGALMDAYDEIKSSPKQ